MIILVLFAPNLVQFTYPEQKNFCKTLTDVIIKIWYYNFMGCSIFLKCTKKLIKNCPIK